MDLNEFLEKENVVLSEGIKFFKESKKLNSYADKVEKALARKESKIDVSKEEKEMAKKFIKTIREAANDFDKIEKKYKYKQLSKEDAKIEHAKLSKKYKGILKDINSERMKKVLMGLGISAAAIASIIGIITPILGLYTTTTVSKVLGSGAYDLRNIK